MKNYLLLLIVSILFTGCSIKMDPASINQEILSQKHENVVQFLASKTYNTYDEKESKITSYFFKDKDGKLTYMYAITYIPMGFAEQLYSPFSQITLTVRRLTNNKASTIEEALAIEVEKNNFKKLFNDKEEYIIGNDFARDLKFSIEEFKEMIQRREDKYGTEVGIIIPIQ